MVAATYSPPYKGGVRVVVGTEDKSIIKLVRDNFPGALLRKKRVKKTHINILRFRDLKRGYYEEEK